MNYLIGIDAGASATRMVLFDEAGIMMDPASQEYPLYQPKNGQAEQKPEDWRDAVPATLERVVSQAAVEREAIKGISISGQMHGLVILDEAGEMIRPSIIWCDQRAGEEVENMLRIMPKERWIEITANPPLTGRTAAEILWARKHKPENYSRRKHIPFPKDYIRYILTGVFATEASDASGMQLLDAPGRRWSDEVLEALQIDKPMLGKVYESCEVTGTLLPEIAEKTGLMMEVKVAGGAGDNAAAAVGTEIVRDGTASITIGTFGVVFVYSSQVFTDKKGRMHTCCCAVPGVWHIVDVTQGASLSLKWFKDEFCQDCVAETKAQGKNVYDLTNEDVKTIPAGSDRLIYLPYLMGERMPHLDLGCQGVFSGLSVIHTKKHLLRAVMEGVSHPLCDCNQTLKETGVDVTQMMTCRGGRKSPIWRQMLSDLYNRTVKTVQQDGESVLGVAILAGVGCGIYPSVEEACDRLINEKSSTGPVAENVKTYECYYHICQNLYQSLKVDYKELANLQSELYGEEGEEYGAETCR